MIYVAMIALTGLTLLGLYITSLAISKAPKGYQDKYGFHYACKQRIAHHKNQRKKNKGFNYDI